MKKFKSGAFALLALSLLAAYWFTPFSAIAERAAEYFNGFDPDMPAFLAGKIDAIGKEEYMRLRSEYIAEIRGMASGDPAENIKFRSESVLMMDKQEDDRKFLPKSSQSEALLAAWMPIGPAPIPNGQVQSGTQLPVSGRTIAIAVNPTDPNIVYIGTAQGGLYRSTDGGSTWTALLDNALSLAIGTIAIAPSQPDTIYVGTGEPDFSSDSFFGAGIYRIDNASTATPTVSAALGTASFAGRSVSQIIVSPTDPATIFASSTSGVGGIGPASPATLPNRGVYRSVDATSANPTFTQIGPLAAPNNNFNVRDIAIDPSNPNILLANLVASGGGLYRSVNALAASPTFANVSTFTAGTGSTNNLTAEFAAIHPAADANATFYVATGNNAGNTGTGSFLKSIDGGATFTRVNTRTFCNPQCFYDIAIDVDPTNANNVYAGGTGASTFIRSTDGGTTFAASQDNLHTDTHAIAVAPSLPATIYFASDGGIYKSIDSGTTWTSLNNTTILATQFTGLAVHSTDPNYTLGGTQDNGTELQTTSPGNWFRADFGDGGYAVIDQADTSTTLVDLYHTYFNGSTLTGYAYTPSTATATEGNWQFRGCNGGTAANGITCTATVLFYAPLEQGPGSPNNSIYYGADRLYRSVDTGLTNATVSQTFTAPTSAIGISPQNDNVRIIGQSTGGIFGTTTGATTLTDLDASNAVPNQFVARTVIDPNNVNTAYVTLSYFGGNNVYKTTNLNAAAPTWTAAVGSGANVLPQVPVSAFVVDPLNSNYIYAGTDIGVYSSTDGGANWTPFGTGLPRVAVFDMLVVPTGRMLRIATHGKGMYQISLPVAPTAATATVGGRVTTAAGRGIRNVRLTLTEVNGNSRSAFSNAFGYYHFADIAAGETYIISASAKIYTFSQPSQVLNINEDIEEVNFIANSSYTVSEKGK